MTDNEKTAAAKRYFDEQIVPLAKKIAEDLQLPVGSDPHLDSYYENCKKRVWSKADFEATNLQTEAELATALDTMWQADGRPDLAALSSSIASLAIQLRIRGEQDGEISPLIYQMY